MPSVYFHEWQEARLGKCLFVFLLLCMFHMVQLCTDTIIEENTPKCLQWPLADRGIWITYLYTIWAVNTCYHYGVFFLVCFCQLK